MKKTGAVLASLIVGLAMTTLLWAESPSKDRKPEEFFDESMGRLQQSMQDVEATNQQLGQKNTALRNRIQGLREHMRQANDRRVSLFEEEVQLKEMLKLDVQGSVSDDRQDSLQDPLSRIADDNAGISRDISKQQKQQMELQKKTAVLQEELNRLQKETQASEAQLRRVFEEEKKRLSRQIQAGEQRLKAQKAGLKEKQDRLMEKARLKGEEAATKRLLEDKIASLTGELSTLEASSSTLHQQGEGLKGRQNEQLAHVTDEMTHLKIYRDSLRQTMTDISQAQEQIHNEFSVHKDEMDKLRMLLKQENELLKEKLQRLEKTYELKKELQEPAAMAPGALSDPPGKPLAVLRQDADGLQGKIAEQEKLRKMFEEQEVNLTAELGALSRQYAESKQQTQMVRKQTQDSESVSSPQMTALQKKITDLQLGIQQMTEQLAALREVKDMTEKKVESETGVLTSLGQQQTALQEEKVKIGETRQQAAGRVEKDIATLKLRKDVLGNSIEEIRQRYHQDSLAVHRFPEQEPELKEYLSVLKTQNNSLESQLAVLLSTLGQNKYEGETASVAAGSPEQLNRE